MKLNLSTCILMFILFLFFACQEYKGDSYFLEGYVKNINGEPIAYTSIRIPLDSARRKSARAFTDANGHYRIEIPLYHRKVRIGYTDNCHIPTKNAIGRSCVIDTNFSLESIRKEKGKMMMPDIKLQLQAAPSCVLIQGRILDVETGKAISGARFVAPSGMVAAVTNNMGNFHFQWNAQMAKEKINLMFVAKGYHTMNYDTILLEKEGMVKLRDLKMKKIKSYE